MEKGQWYSPQCVGVRVAFACKGMCHIHIRKSISSIDPTRSRSASLIWVISPVDVDQSISPIGIEPRSAWPPGNIVCYNTSFLRGFLVWGRIGFAALCALLSMVLRGSGTYLGIFV